MSISSFFRNLFSQPKEQNPLTKSNIPPKRKYVDKDKVKDNTKSLRKGELGEYKIDIQLEKLPKEYKYLSDLLLPNSKSSTGYSQIDHVVITPYGILVIETKNYVGEITGGRQDKTWLQNGKYPVYNPFWQNYGHVEALKSILKNDQLQFYSIISFTRRCIFKVDPELRKITSKDLIVYDTELSEFVHRKITSLNREYGKPLLNDLDINNTYEVLKGAHIDDKNIRQDHVEKIRSTKAVNPSDKCAICGKPISEKIKKYCLSNDKKYKGKIYCMEHQ